MPDITQPFPGANSGSPSKEPCAGGTQQRPGGVKQLPQDAQQQAQEADPGLVFS